MKATTMKAHIWLSLFSFALSTDATSKAANAILKKVDDGLL